jgi:hypothetical protein
VLRWCGRFHAFCDLSGVGERLQLFGPELEMKQSIDYLVQPLKPLCHENYPLV